MRIPKLPAHALVLGAVFMLALSVPIKDAMYETKIGLEKAQVAYTGALASTTTQLSGLLRSTISDAGLAKNVSWGLNNSVHQSLASKLRHGELDQIFLFGPGCKLVASASLIKKLPFDCPYKKENLKKIKSGFYWTSADGRPLLGLILPMKSKKRMKALGVVQLNSNWLHLYPNLEKQIYTHNMHIVSEGTDYPGTIFIREGFNNEKQALASLAVDGILAQFISVNKSGPLTNPFFWPCILLAAFFGSVLWLRDVFYKNKITRTKGNFVDWCKSLSPISGDDDPSSGPGQANNEISEFNFACAQNHITLALQAKIDTIRKITHKKGDLEKQIKERDKIISEHRKQISEMSELDSLMQQLQSTTSSFLDRMKEIKEQTETIKDTIARPLIERSNTTLDILRGWQNGIRSKGSRKFLRSLSETPGNNPGLSLLDEQLILLKSITTEVNDQAIAASIQTSELLDACTSATKLASLWYGLSTNSEGNMEQGSFIENILQAQDLIKLSGKHSVTFRNLFTDSIKEFCPTVPPTIMISSLYHVFLGLNETSTSGRTEIVCRERVHGGKALLILSVSTETSEAPEIVKKQMFQLDIASSLLLRYKVEMNFLPTLEKPFPLALSWNAEDIDHEGGRPLLLQKATQTPNTRV